MDLYTDADPDGDFCFVLASADAPKIFVSSKVLSVGMCWPAHTLQFVQRFRVRGMTYEESVSNDDVKTKNVSQKAND